LERDLQAWEIREHKTQRLLLVWLLSPAEQSVARRPFYGEIKGTKKQVLSQG
jgi:hypothetical protein